MPALVATLARVRRIDLLHSARLVVQHPAQPAPTTFRNSPVQGRFRLDILAWLVHRALGRLHHVPDFQVFHADRPESTRQVATDMMPPVVPDVGDPPVQFRHDSSFLLAAVRVHHDDFALPGPPRLPVRVRQWHTLAPLHLALMPLQPDLEAGNIWHEDSVGFRGRHVPLAHVYAHRLAVILRLRVRDFPEHRHIPFSVGMLDHHGLFRFPIRPRIAALSADRHPAHPGHVQFPVRNPHVLRNGERITVFLVLEPRKAALAFPGLSHRIRIPLQDVPHFRVRQFLQPFVPFAVAQFRELQTQREKGRRRLLAFPFLIGFHRVAVLSDRPVPDVTVRPSDAGQHLPPAQGARIQAIDGRADHAGIMPCRKPMRQKFYKALNINGLSTGCSFCKSYASVESFFVAQSSISG